MQKIFFTTIIIFLLSLPSLADILKCKHTDHISFQSLDKEGNVLTSEKLKFEQKEDTTISIAENSCEIGFSTGELTKKTDSVYSCVFKTESSLMMVDVLKINRYSGLMIYQRFISGFKGKDIVTVFSDKYQCEKSSKKF
jgi:hypothetical protein